MASPCGSHVVVEDTDTKNATGLMEFDRSDHTVLKFALLQYCTARAETLDYYRTFGASVS